MSKKKYKKKRLESNTVLVAIDKSEVSYSGKMIHPSGENMVITDGSNSKDTIVTYSSLVEFSKLMNTK